MARFCGKGRCLVEREGLGRLASVRFRVSERNLVQGRVMLIREYCRSKIGTAAGAE